MDGTSGSTVRADSTKTSSRTDAVGKSDSTGINEVAVRSFFGWVDFKGVASVDRPDHRVKLSYWHLVVVPGSLVFATLGSAVLFLLESALEAVFFLAGLEVMYGVVILLPVLTPLLLPFLGWVPSCFFLVVLVDGYEARETKSKCSTEG